ncbi:hypothetical protein LSH36_271g06047 [Paralvinella palmiformis]|uniref:WIF domain-containing protein n=1 Tax=Paralvinella palmiformis TaxID=53620 RepID=A0AAD9JJG4_9ANNE|nr:hypothetical protein LSH36_271g06047 [Paralvinella palmiformis]
MFSVIPGIEGDLFYVRNGTVNDYALSFNLLIRPEHDNIYFCWQNLRSSTQFPIKPEVELSWPSAIFFTVSYTVCVCSHFPVTSRDIIDVGIRHGKWGSARIGVICTEINPSHGRDSVVFIDECSIVYPWKLNSVMTS